MSGFWHGLVTIFTGVLAALGFGQTVTPAWNGYVEADYVYIAPVTPGRITAVHVREGDPVRAGELLVELETDAQTAALAAAKAGVAQAQANLDNLETGRRDAEIQVIVASLKSAMASRDLAKQTYDRTSALFARGQATSAQMQTAEGTLAQADAQVQQFQAQLQVAKLPARPAQLSAAEAALNVAKSQQKSAAIALADRRMTSPIDGRVDQRFSDPGEVAGAGAAILSLYDPGKLKVIFYVPEAKRSGVKLGEVLDVSCDGCKPGLTAKITRIGVEPQFTPPILYSRDERGRLVFRAEARLMQSDGLSPGQPVSILPEDGQ